MSIWGTTSVTDTPEVVLSSWRVMEVTSPYWEGTSKHFVGYNETEHEGRVSSEIQSFDATTGKGITRSGRVYQLVGSSGYNSDAQYVWQRWKNINHAETEIDVTDKIEALCKKIVE